ncbi:hypothetical protein SteCoe_17289 [Stentor coeruleus]|uniref:Uncharacterized protein n=1 Tax=Stentor coeruleus TaxID=5963 RepID=A0A1R2BZ96_9CILI|nr:hypothetical protein SteCoe_17289 [Stentor coeruleus]
MASRTIKTTHTEELKVTTDKMPEPLPSAPLVTFDLNLSNLQDYLNKVSSLINRHTLYIQNLTEEINTKVSQLDGFEILEGIALSIPNEIGGRKPRNNDWKDGISASTSGIQGMCDEITKLESHKKKTQKKLKELKNTLSSKISTEKFESEKKILEDKIQDKISKDEFLKKISSFENMVKQVEESFHEKAAEMDKKVSELEVNTLWKIRDCENLLKTRVNEKFVWDAINTLEQKIKKEQENLESGRMKKHQNLFEILEKELKQLEGEMLNRTQQAKKSIEDIEKILPKKIDEDQYKYLLSLINKEQDDPYKSSIKSIEKKIKELEDKIQTFIYKIPDDPSEDILKLTGQLEYLRSEIEKKAEREPILEIINSLKNVKPQIVQSQPQELGELWKFREKTLQNFDKIDEKFEKLSKAMDLTVIKRALASKANEDQTKEEFISVGQRLLDLEHNQNEISKELDRVNLLIRRILQTIEDLGNKSGFALISKKSFVNNCLSCGRGDSSYIPTIPHVQGYDGRFYKADMSAFNPGVSDPDWKFKEDEIPISKSPISMTKLQKVGLNSVLGKDLSNSLSTASLNPKKGFRPLSARK